MIRDVMLDPARLRRCIDSGEGVDDERIARELARIAAACFSLTTRVAGASAVFAT